MTASSILIYIGKNTGGECYYQDTGICISKNEVFTKHGLLFVMGKTAEFLLHMFQSSLPNIFTWHEEATMRLTSQIWHVLYMMYTCCFVALTGHFQGITPNHVRS